jgi:hypothetical protein
MSDHYFRAAVLRAHGATDGELAELLAYTHNSFEPPAAGVVSQLPWADEPCVAAWERYAAEADREGVATSLRRRLVQLRFPVAAGVSASVAYRAATRRGELGEMSLSGEGIAFARPRGLRLFIHQTAVGRVPVIVADAREDFVSLVRALVHRNEPVRVPDSMGACIVAGYNNWDRISELRAEWERAHPDDRSAAGWPIAFKDLTARRELYQDSLILLSSGPYSGIPAHAMRLGDREWLEKSLVIRLEHECTHYITQRALGSMHNSILDELIADYMGIVAAIGRYRADWFLRFMGLESYPCYRRTGRLENYRGEPPLSDRAFTVVQALVKSAAEQLERLDLTRANALRSPADDARLIIALARLGLETLASEEGAALLVQ